jgi:predicted enzyme related to lactoylglutathione lyase
MTDAEEVSAQGLTPILYVRDFGEAMSYYTEKLLFRKLWDWGKPPGFGAVALGNVEIFLRHQAQGQPGMWLCIFMEDVDAYHARISKLGAEIIRPPMDEPWGMREMHVRDPNQHVIRFGHGIPSREPKLEIQRVDIEARIEQRLAALLGDLARHKNMTIGQTLEEMLLHSFEALPHGGVASPHTENTLRHIQELKKKHAIEYDCHASYRFVEK